MDRDRSTPTAPRISCVVPAYNEAGNLDALLRALSAELDALRLAWEIVIVDDGSADATLAALRPWLAVPPAAVAQLRQGGGAHRRARGGARRRGRADGCRPAAPAGAHPAHARGLARGRADGVHGARLAR
jgi:hypothetical protein